MKKILTLSLALVMTMGLAQPVRGAGEEIVGHALYTEIVAEIDGKAIASYNVAGRTAVMVQDLAWYGFYVFWNEEAGAAYVWPENIRPGGPLEGEPNFVPQPPEGTVGEPAYPIYASDVKVYVAGEEKESFNIGGHVMVYLSDLLPYGELSWNQEEKIAAFQVAEDPVRLAMERKEAELKESGLSYQFERYPGLRGTVAVYSQGGTPHGSACMMLYVDQSGKQTRIDLLLPSYGFGPQYYLNPREIAFDETGNLLTFVTPVKSETEAWGDTLCTFDTGTGQITSMVPLNEELEQWDAYCAGIESAIDGQKPTEITVTREPGAYEASIQSARFAYSHIGVSVSNESVLISESFFGTGTQDEESTYQKAVSALRSLKIPDVTDENFVQANTDDQREQASQYIQVTKNGQPISGVLWWSRGNGHVDLNFTFDQSVSLDVGDIVEVWMGVPEEK